MESLIVTGGLRPHPATARLEVMTVRLSATSRRIAEFVLGNVAEVIGMSAAELAGKIACSQGSVVNLAKAVGYPNFQKFKIALAQDIVKPVLDRNEPLKANDPLATVVRKVFARQIHAQQDTRDFLDIHALRRAVEAIRAARCVEIYGTGSSAPIAKLIGYALIRIGINANVAIDAETQAVSADLAGPNVVILSIAHWEPGQSMMTATRLAHERGAKTIVLTDSGKSPIHAFADIVLSTAARQKDSEFDPIFSRIDQVAILDALIACVAAQRPDA